MDTTATKPLRAFIVGFQMMDGTPKRVRIEAADYGEPIADAVEALGGNPETIASVWEE